MLSPHSPPVTRYSLPSCQPLRIVTLGHVDHGKSTLLGRLLYDTCSLSQEQLAALETASKAEGVPLEFAFVLDSFLEEQSQNITIDTTQISFRTPARDYLLIDAPGHKEFLKNMVTGASSATAALLLIDCIEGLQEQTRRHVQLLALLGIRQVIVLINKMDLVVYSSSAFKTIARATEYLFQEFDLPLPQIIPVAARFGDNIATPSTMMPWYHGPMLLKSLETLETAPSLTEGPLRLVIQDVYRFDERRLLVGRIESGMLHVGDEIVFWPHGKKSRVRSLETWSKEEISTTASAGQSIAITLEEPIFVERGQIGSHPHTPPTEGDKLCVKIFWLDPEPLIVHQPITLKLGTQSVEGSLTAVTQAFDATTLMPTTEPRSFVAQHEVATVVFHTKHSLAYDRYDQVPATGRLAIALDERLGGGGIILKAEPAPIFKRPIISTHLSWNFSTIDRETRKKQFGHPGAVLWFTGLSGSGKSTLATGLESLLHQQGMATFVLDGDNLRHGLCADLGFSLTDRSENIRRTGETAKLFAEAGLVVLCALISPFHTDRALVRASCARDGIPFVEIFVDASLTTCEKRDPRGLYAKARHGEIAEFTGITSPYEVPTTPDLHLSTDQRSSEEVLSELFAFVTEWLKT